MPVFLGLTVAHGVARRGDDPRKVRSLESGLLALGGVIWRSGWTAGPGAVRLAARPCYFLWSMERVAVALDLQRIGKKDWYGWGVEVLLANQQPDDELAGSVWELWSGHLFRAACFCAGQPGHRPDGQVQGSLWRPRPALLRGGGIGGKKPGRQGSEAEAGSGSQGHHRQGRSGPRPEAERPGKSPEPERKSPGQSGRAPPARPLVPVENTESARLAGSLVRAPADEQGILLGKLRDSKGVQYTEALATAIPQLKGEAKTHGRDALAARLARMKATTLKNYLKDEDAEIRRAAALACAIKETKEHIPTLIDLLLDPEPVVERAAHTALKTLTGQDFGPALGANRAERAKAIVAWQLWWSKQGK